MKLFLITTLNGLTLAALYFLVASGLSLIFGLMRNINMAHGSIYLLGAYIGFQFQEFTGSWYLGIAAACISLSSTPALIIIPIRVLFKNKNRNIPTTMDVAKINNL